MLLKIKRKNCLDKYRVFPLRGYDYEKDEEEFFYPEVFRSYILTIPSKSFKGHVKVLGMELTNLAKKLQVEGLVFLGDTETPWLYQYNDYKPVKAAQEYLTANKVGKQFNGAIQMSIPDLPVFISHLAWLTRCNAALPYFYFIDAGQNILGNICKYGNLHLDTLNEQSDKLVSAFVDKSKFKYGDENSCYNWPGKTSAIRGRRIVV
jgi:hypothetical protein